MRRDVASSGHRFSTRSGVLRLAGRFDAVPDLDQECLDLTRPLRQHDFRFQVRAPAFDAQRSSGKRPGTVHLLVQSQPHTERPAPAAAFGRFIEDKLIPVFGLDFDIAPVPEEVLRDRVNLFDCGSIILRRRNN